MEKFFSTDNVCLLAGGQPQAALLDPEIDTNPESTQQPADGPQLYPLGLPVKWYVVTKTDICTVLEDNEIQCRVCVLGSKDILTLPKSSLTPIHSPNSYMILLTHQDINLEDLNICVTKENLDRFWN